MGGFASVRTRNLAPPLDVSPYGGMALRLFGDGQRYKFIMRSSEVGDLAELRELCWLGFVWGGGEGHGGRCAVRLLGLAQAGDALA